MLFRAQALLADIDGTLVDSTAAVVASWTTWAAMHRLDAGEILRVCHGRRTRDTVAMFLPAEQVSSATRQIEELESAALDDVTALPGPLAAAGGLHGAASYRRRARRRHHRRLSPRHVRTATVDKPPINVIG